MEKIDETESAVPANAMGGSSSVAGTGGIDTVDPLLVGMMKRRVNKPKKLRDILKQEINKDKRYGV